MTATPPRPFDEGDYLVYEGSAWRRAIMADLDRARNFVIYVWRDGAARRLGRPWPLSMSERDPRPLENIERELGRWW